MKKLHSFLLIAIAGIVLSSCSKKPTAKFSVAPTEPLIQEEVTFTNSSTNAVSYSWDFGDGTSSDEKSPKKSYDKEGSYTVTLTAYSKGNKSQDKSSQTVIVGHPTALFTGELNGNEVKYYAGVSDVTSMYGVSASFGSGTYTATYDAAIGGFDPGEEYMGIEIGTLTVSDTLTTAERYSYFHSLIKVQSYPYTFGAANGIKVTYKASNGVVWSSDAGTADQTGSSCVFTWTENFYNGFDETEKFKAHVNCKLYNGLGQSLTLTNAIFELSFACL